jgi:O-antigen/teichoic acid export membrane protein
VLDIGTRVNVLAMVPICIVLWVSAPDLLKLWLGNQSGECVLILRILLIAEIFDSIALGSATVLLGLGAAGTVLAVDLAALAASIALCLLLVLCAGASGAAIALALTVAAGSVIYVNVAARRCGTSAVGLLFSVGAGLGLPAAACMVTAVLFNWFLTPSSRATLLIMAIASGLAYISTLRFHGARLPEAKLLSSIASFPLHWIKSLSVYLQARYPSVESLKVSDNNSDISTSENPGTNTAERVRPGI